MNFAEIIDIIANAAKSRLITREVKLPGDRPGYVVLDAAGNETVIIERDKVETVSYEVARAIDMIEFAKSIPSRYGVERAAGYREIYVMVNSEDVPQSVSLGEVGDDKRLRGSFVNFDLKQHRDFVRWMSAKNLTQTQFRNLVIELAEQHDQHDLGGQLQILNYKVEINYDATVETERDVVFGFTAKEMQGQFQIPKMITVNCPVVAGANFTTEIKFEVVIIRPTDPKDKLKFSLEPFGKDRVHLVREAYGHVVDSEVITPLQEVIKGYAEVIPPTYLRSSPAPTTNTQVDSTLMKINAR